MGFDLAGGSELAGGSDLTTLFSDASIYSLSRAEDLLAEIHAEIRDWSEHDGSDSVSGSDVASGFELTSPFSENSI